MKEKDIKNYKKDPMYYCELIITYIMKLIENDYLKNKVINKIIYKKSLMEK